MDTITLPAQSLREMLGVLSFYDNPSCRISFHGPQLDARITSDDNLVEVAWKNLREIKKEPVFFQLTWKNKTIKSKKKTTYLYYETSDFDQQCLHGNIPRCYAHEYTIEEIGTSKLDKYGESPLVLLGRGHFYQPRIRTFNFTKEDIKQALRGNDDDTDDDIDEMLADFGMIPKHSSTHDKINYRTYNDNTEEEPEEEVKLDYDYDYDYESSKDMNLGFGVEPLMIPNKVNFHKIDNTPLNKIKTGLFICGLRLFPSYIQKNNIVVDGLTNNDGQTIITFPLSERPLTLQEFQLLQRHPYLPNYTKNLIFWNRIGIVSFRKYIRKKQAKGDCYFETL